MDVKSVFRRLVGATQVQRSWCPPLASSCTEPRSLQTQASDNLFFQGKNLVTKASIMESLYSFEARNSHVHRVFWTDREGEAPDRTAYYPSMDYGVDSNRTFELQDLIIFTDFLEVPQTLLTRQCNKTANQLPCLVKGCYAREEVCDGVRDCDDGWDESDCGDPEVLSQELTYRYRMSRFNRYDDFYDNWDGEWGWFDTNIDEDREQFVTIEVPETADDWFFTAFSVSRQYGIAVFDELVEYSTIRPLFMFCEAAEIVHRGETVTLKCTIFNWTPTDMEAVVVLEASDDYDFVHVEEYGYVASYNPRRSSGEHHHFMFIRGYPDGSPSGQSSVDVYFPIAPKIQHGTLEATVSIRSQLFYGSQTMEIEVIGEASLVHRHTSVLLDLKTRAFELEFMNIIVDEDPVIPYEVYRRYVSGSPVAMVTVSGDTIGPTFPDDMVGFTLSEKSLLRKPRLSPWRPCSRRGTAGMAREPSIMLSTSLQTPGNSTTSASPISSVMTTWT